MTNFTQEQLAAMQEAELRGDDPLRALTDGRSGRAKPFDRPPEGLLPFEVMERDGPPNLHVMQDWTQYLTLRMQGVLVQALRGPDGMLKESRAKAIVRALRGVCMVSGRDRAPMGLGLVYTDDPFMQTILIGSPSPMAWQHAVKDFFADVDSYNIHFYQHLAQAWACVGIGHPSPIVRARSWDFYVAAADAFHWMPETVFDFMHRLRDGRDIKHDNAVKVDGTNAAP